MAVTLRFSVGRKYAVLTLHPLTPSPMDKHRLAALGASLSGAGGGGGSGGSRSNRSPSPTSTSPRSPQSSSTSSTSTSPRASDVIEEWGGDAGLAPVALLEAAERAMNEEDIPVYLEEEVRAGLHYLHLADVAEPPAHVAAALLSLSPAGGPPSPAPAQWAALFKSRSLVWKDSSEPTNKHKRFLRMAEAHKAMATTTKGIEALQKLEELLGTALGEVLSKRETAMADLHRNQSEEMNKACSTDNENPEISSLVAKHIKQMELEERKWDVRLARMRKDQKKLYVRCLLRWSAMATPPTVQEVVAEYNAYEQALIAAAAGPSDKAGGKGAVPVRAGRGAAGGDGEGLRSSAAGGGDKKKKGWWGKKSSEESESGDSSPRPIETAEGKGRWETFSILLGRTKSLHHISLGLGDVLQLCRLRSESTGQTEGGASRGRPHTIRNLYSNALQAAVLVVDKNLTYSTKTNKEFLRLCNSSIDPHFGGVSSQLMEAKNRMGRPFQAGDCFITRHSNLESIHVMFHLVGDNEPVNKFTSDSPLLKGLRNLLDVAFEYDVATLSMPILLKEQVSEIEASYKPEECARAADVVLKFVKVFLIEKSAAEDNSLKSINFLCSRNMFTHYHGVIDNIFARYSTRAFMHG